MHFTEWTNKLILYDFFYFNKATQIADKLYEKKKRKRKDEKIFFLYNLEKNL